MAGEWIKMRTNLWDDPRVSQLCDQTGASEAAIVGALYWLWSAADEHTENGVMPGLSTGAIDRKTGIRGIGAALVAIGWVDDTEGGITINHFDEHNGASAKSRVLTAKRVANHKANAQVTLPPLAEEQDTVSTALPREEKNREEKKETKSKTTTPPDGDLFIGIDPQIVTDFKAMRTKQRAAVTKTAIDGIQREAGKAGLSLADALTICCERGWRGFKAEWVLQPNRASPASGPVSQLGRAGQATAANAQRLIEKMRAENEQAS
ncbi:hypothetical protein ACFOFO_05265 [Undibacterium arcticum]|uniref:DUF1376 domain-containing protein n=1 Tax=Undibacterium arcticum TaxID=1762892 RepID=A0ABV7F0Z8_9BURK